MTPRLPLLRSSNQPDNWGVTRYTWAKITCTTYPTATGFGIEKPCGGGRLYELNPAVTLLKAPGLPGD